MALWLAWPRFGPEQVTQRSTLLAPEMEQFVVATDPGLPLFPLLYPHLSAIQLNTNTLKCSHFVVCVCVCVGVKWS